jgi:polysaccharide biosynthesis/export protein
MIRLLVIVMMLVTTSCATAPLVMQQSSGPYAYKVATGDRLRITVFGEPTLSGEFALDGTGSIAYPLLGLVNVSAKSTGEVRNEITMRLGTEFVRNPKVSVEVANFRPVYILGEVARPGEFAYVEGLTAYALVAKAGGFTYRANQKAIFVRHESSTSETAYALNGSFTIRPGDTVRIGERYF